MRLLLATLLVSMTVWGQSAGRHGQTATVQTMSTQRPGYLGAGVVEVTPDRAKALKLASAAGVEVKRVDDNSAAAKAGLKVDDVIIEINGQKVESLDQFVHTITNTLPGTKVAMAVWREGAKRTLNATLAARPDELLFAFPPEAPLAPFEIIPAPAPMIGIEGETLTPQLAQYFGVEEGVLVRTVNPHGAAEKAGLKAGDVIVKVNGTPVTSTREISGLLRAGRKPMVFTVVRNHKEITLNIELALEFDPWLNWGLNRGPNGSYLAFFRAS